MVNHESKDDETGFVPVEKSAVSEEALCRRSDVPSSQVDDSTLRKDLGKYLTSISDQVNSNLIVARYVTVSSVILLGAYGIAQSPIFYRYRNVMDISNSMFIRRKWIHGRIMGVVENSKIKSSISTNWNEMSQTEQSTGLSSLLSAPLKNLTVNQAGSLEFPSKKVGQTLLEQENIATVQPVEHPITVLFRHSSPLERLLTQSAMDSLFSITGKSPSRLLYASANPNRNLLPIELSGVSLPFSTESSVIGISTNNGLQNHPSLLHELAQQRTRVSLQLLAQRTRTTPSKPAYVSSDSALDTRIPNEFGTQHTAICHMHYRKRDQWFRTTNVSLELVKVGQALVTSHGVVPPSKHGVGNSNISNFYPTVEQLKMDAALIAELEGAEYTAWKSRIGVWSDSSIRLLRKEYQEEEDHDSNQLWTRMWRLMRRSWSWVRG